VGANGAGKTRLLERIRSSANDYRAQLGQALPGVTAPYRADLEPLWKAISGASPHKISNLIAQAAATVGLPDQIASFLRSAIDSLPWRTQGEARLLRLERPGVSNAVQTPESVTAGQLASIPEISLNLTQGWQNVELLYNALARQAHIHMDDVERELDDERRSKALASLKRLEGVLSRASSALVSADRTKLDLRPPLFDGKRIVNAGFSEGQKVLVSWFTTLYATQQAIGEDLVVLLDEPELHLHPKASIEAIAGLEQHLGSNSQIWLATHSVSLALGLQAMYPSDCTLVYVDKGQAQYASNRLDKVAEGLLGSKDARLAMRRLLADADEVEFHRFVAEALAPPTVAAHKEGDPQVAQATGLLKGAVLDFAPGQGRLARQLAQQGASGVDYYAFIPPQYSGHRGECVNAIKALYPSEDPEHRIFSDVSAARTRFSGGFSQVLLCNVLHEIAVDDWREVFQKVASMLPDNGELLLLEDQSPAKGELPHKGGFVVLAPDEVRDLFGTQSTEAVKVVDVRHKDRLTAISISKSVLGQCNGDTIRKALSQVANRACEKMDTLVGTSKSDARAGREYAFHALQFTYASRYLTRHST
jgi:hypothetical protein